MPPTLRGDADRDRSQAGRPASLLAALGVLAGLALGGPASALPTAPPVLSLGSLFPEYGPGAPVRLSLQLTLAPVAGGSWTVVTQAEGTVAVASLTRDGSPVVPEVGEPDFEDDPVAALCSSRAPLAPGGKLALPLTLTPDPWSDGVVLTTFDLRPAPPAANPRAMVPPPPSHPPSGKAAARTARPPVGKPVLPPPAKATVVEAPVPRVLRYLLTRPGTYVLRLRYHPPGCPGDPADAFTGSLDSNAITFRLP